MDIWKWVFGRPREDGLAPFTEPDAVPGFPSALLPHRDALEATRLPIVGAEVLEVPPADARASRLGGFPWWPLGQPYPEDKDGRPLLLLVQINFDEMPVLRDFPTDGLLQIFIGQDDLYGCNLDDQFDAASFRVHYHARPDGPHMQDFAFLQSGDADPLDYSPLEKPLEARGLSFSAGSMTMDVTDFRFEKVLPGLSSDEQLFETYAESCDFPPIRLGGYPTFTQADPRAYRASRLPETSLITIDTTDGIMWGDVGVAQFFIERDALRRADFSRVAYNWDCC